MRITSHHPDRHAERVETHKWAFTTARTISLGAGIAEKATTYFSRNDAITLSRYSWHAAHHALIRRIVLSSQHTSPASPVMIASMVSMQCRLYGTMISGSS